MTPPKPPTKIIPTGWKSEFKDGEVLAIKGHSFYVVAVTRRGLALRKLKPLKQTG